jgi:hypothetical protein
MTIYTRICAALAMLSVAACADGSAAPPNVTFDGARALEYVKLQVEAGPRIPGTTPHRLVGDRIVQELRKCADTVIEQTWIHVSAKGDSLPMRNIFARFNLRAAKRILYVSHWDSRPHADNSFAVDDKQKPVPGADDGASSTALLIVLAEALKAQPTTVGVDLLFTDGEDYGEFGPPQVDVLIGAKYYADHILPDSSYRPLFGVLWDMIGNKGVRVMKETIAEDHYPEVNERVWKMAAALGYASVFINERYQVTDDHVPLIEKHFPIIDVIDLQGYPHHHTTQDTIDKVSAESLTIMGRVALALIRAEEAKK